LGILRRRNDPARLVSEFEHHKISARNSHDSSPNRFEWNYRARFKNVISVFESGEESGRAPLTLVPLLAAFQSEHRSFQIVVPDYVVTRNFFDSIPRNY